MKQFLSRFRTSVAASVAVLLIVSLTVTGCTPAQQAQVKTVVAQIGAEIPKVLPMVQAATTAADLLLPGDALLVSGVSATVQAGLTELAALCNTYAASPSDSVWQSIQATISSLINSGAGALLDAAKITDPASRQTATAVLGALQTALLIIDSIVQNAQTKTQIKASASLRAVKLRQIEPYLDRSMVARETGHSFPVAYGYETALGF